MRTMRPSLSLPAGFQLAFTILLAIVPFISATSPRGPSRHSRQERHIHDPVVEERYAPALPAGWVYSKCYTDDPTRPTLSGWSLTDTAGMSVDLCVDFCKDKYFTLAGLENGNQCHCGNITTDGATTTSSDNCGTPCIGNVNEYCGGSDSLSLYWSGYQPQNKPSLVQAMKGWNMVGCFYDSNDARILSQPKNVTGGQFLNSVETCIETCRVANYPYAGVEFGVECWCGMHIKNRAMKEMDTKYCSVLACPGNTLEYCGAVHSLIVYSALASSS